MEQTAVEWLWNKLSKGEFINDPEELFELAKKIEMQQIADAHLDGSAYGKEKDGEQYYNETFKSE